MVNLFFKKHWSRCHRNEFWLWSWTQGKKIEIGCWEWTSAKGRNSNDSKDEVLRNSTGWREFTMNNSACIKWGMSGPSMTGAKKWNQQKFWVWATYNSKWTEIWFLVMHLVQPGSNWQYNYNQHKHSHQAPLGLSWGHKKHILVQMNILFKDNFYNINSGISRIFVGFNLWKIKTKEALHRQKWVQNTDCSFLM